MKLIFSYVIYLKPCRFMSFLISFGQPGAADEKRLVHGRRGKGQFEQAQWSRPFLGIIRFLFSHSTTSTHFPDSSFVSIILLAQLRMSSIDPMWIAMIVL